MSVIKPALESVLISESCLQQRIRELGTQIFTDYENQELVLLGVLRGGVIFFPDLARAIFKAQHESQTREVALRFEFVQLVSYHDSMRPSTVQLIHEGSDYLKQQHVLIVEDIIDTGRTLDFLCEHLQMLNPKTIKVCTLLDKPSQRQVLNAKYLLLLIISALKFQILSSLDMDLTTRSSIGIYPTLLL